MNCSDLDSLLHPHLDGELPPDLDRDVRDHLQHCQSCAGAVRQEGGFLFALRSRGQAAMHSPANQASPSLRARILQEVSREERKAVRLRWLLPAAAALLLVAGGSAWIVGRRGDRIRFVEDGALRHARGLPAEVQGASPETIERWFGGKLDHPVFVPRFSNAVVSGARLSNVKDRPAAYISYEAQGSNGPHRVGLFVFEDTERAVQVRAFPFVEVDDSHGFNVAMWRRGGVVYQLVSDLEEADLERMLFEQGVRPSDRQAPPQQSPLVPALFTR